jgi:hypothetical protein
MFIPLENVQSLRNLYTPWHLVKHINLFHVTDFVTYGYGFIIVMCPREGGGKGLQRTLLQNVGAVY